MEHMTKSIHRRGFLTACAAASASAALGRIAYAQQAGFVAANVQLDPSASSQRVLGEFMGLSFEASLIPGGAFFNGGNRALIDYVRGLGGRGILQFGGSNVDRTTYGPDDLTKLAQFAGAVNWRVVLGLGLSGSAFTAADQAYKASQALGERLLAFELGNAPDLTFATYGAYLAAFRAAASSVTTNDAGAMFAGPGTATHPDWATRFAQDARAQLVTLTQQYRHTGGEASLRYGVRDLAKAAQVSDLPYRIEQIVSTSGNNMANALWAVDFAFELADNGADGANFHDDADAQQTPLYLGLQLFKESVNARLVATKVQSTHPNLNVWAVEQDGGQRLVTILNRDSNIGATVNLNAARPARNGRVKRLTALSMETSQINVVDWQTFDPTALDVPPASAALLSV